MACPLPPIRRSSDFLRFLVCGGGAQGRISNFATDELIKLLQCIPGSCTAVRILTARLFVLIRSLEFHTPGRLGISVCLPEDLTACLILWLRWGIMIQVLLRTKQTDVVRALRCRGAERWRRRRRGPSGAGGSQGRRAQRAACPATR